MAEFWMPLNYIYIDIKKNACVTQFVTHIAIHIAIYIIARLHNKRREEEYPTLTIPCTNILHKVHAVNHWILSFCINTFRVTEDLRIS